MFIVCQLYYVLCAVLQRVLKLCFPCNVSFSDFPGNAQWQMKGAAQVDHENGDSRLICINGKGRVLYVWVLYAMFYAMRLFLLHHYRSWIPAHPANGNNAQCGGGYSAGSAAYRRSMWGWNHLIQDFCAWDSVCVYIVLLGGRLCANPHPITPVGILTHHRILSIFYITWQFQGKKIIITDLRLCTGIL